MTRTPNTDAFSPLAREFHVALAARKRYGFDHRVFSQHGHVVFADLHACRLFCQRINSTRDIRSEPAQTVYTSDIYAMGLIEEIMHYVITQYREQTGMDVFARARDALVQRFSEEQINDMLIRYVEAFPPQDVYQKRMTAVEYLDTEYDGETGREVALEEMLLLALENRNPAYAPFGELFDDSQLRLDPTYPAVVQELQSFFVSEAPFGPKNQNLVEFLSEPMTLFPQSLYDQLAYIRENWGHLIGKYLFRLLRGLDFLREDAMALGRGGGPGETKVLEYGDSADYWAGLSGKRFSPDRFWMPRVVLLAKTTLVWLDQLSRSYGYEITRLDQVPNEELDRIASYGFTGLWLIGLWERSAASKRIKHLCGNPDAEASAYSLHDYQIANRLGGWEGLENLRARCEERGIRLASDMVPNHTGIDSAWVHEHPDWFVQLPWSPFPGYSFNGENLSSDPETGIYLEDHYYDRTDAAVVFKRVDHRSGEERFIYHGNDGTQMPWNDTAQLDFTNEEVREAVIQTILQVARNFSIIRFDAAMTLARKHVQRLWFPEPGSGGDIASRSEHGMTKEEFLKHMPREFWRDVVDRVAAEVPDTLLLAEAFWMMEGYFVRTLGMHRVYNSAFMNMLKNEENEKYRQTVKNTLEFDPQILKRFVNFMNNPDEETAVAQFGKGDKYFGVATLMLTMPGLPMVGHGQIEGYAEKYGMEYSRAYWDESIDTDLVARHERELFPLARRRWMFAEVEEFELYDVHRQHGGVAESVFAYSNQVDGAKSLVLYNNAYDRVVGSIRHSTGVKRGEDESLSSRSLGDALGLRNRGDAYALLHEHVSDLWYIRNAAEIHEHGLSVILEGYETQVFVDIHEVTDSSDGHYRRLAEELGGAGVPDVDHALKQQFLRPLHAAFDALSGSDPVTRLHAVFDEKRPLTPDDRAGLRDAYQSFAHAVVAEAGLSGRTEDAAGHFVRRCAVFELLSNLAPDLPDEWREFFARLSADDQAWHELLGYLLLEPLSLLNDGFDEASDVALHYDAVSTVDDLMLGWKWTQQSGATSVEPALTMRSWISAYTSDLTPEQRALKLVSDVLEDHRLSENLGVNRGGDILWYREEGYNDFVFRLQYTGALAVLDDVLADTFPDASFVESGEAGRLIADGVEEGPLEPSHSSSTQAVSSRVREPVKQPALEALERVQSVIKVLNRAHETAGFKLELLTEALDAAAQAKHPVRKPAKKSRRR
ncbi:MAG: alpha-amylase family glycosyl hydrolase [bacterium]